MTNSQVELFLFNSQEEQQNITNLYYQWSVENDVSPFVRILARYSANRGIIGEDADNATPPPGAATAPATSSATTAGQTSTSSSANGEVCLLNAILHCLFDQCILHG